MEIDFHRALVFPNRIRKFRKQMNIGSLLELSEILPTITYIRLSKIERGEVFARADELRLIALALGVKPEELLIDVDDPAFDIAAWAEPLHGTIPVDPDGERAAVLLAAALRARRGSDPALTIATLEQDYGIAPVVLSRIENALKPLERWNDDVRSALRRLFDMEDDRALATYLQELAANGDLNAVLPLVANPQVRLAKSRTRIAALRDELANEPSLRERPTSKTGVGNEEDAASTPRFAEGPTALVRLLPVFGSPLPDGLIAHTPSDVVVEAPRSAGPRAYGLRVGRPTLGAGLPGRATLVVDPDRFPAAGGLAVVREQGGLRVVSVAVDRNGRMLGYSQVPDVEAPIDRLDPDTVAAVLSAVFE